MQFQNCTKTGLTQNFVYSKRHCLRFVLESILRKQRPNVWVKSQLRACVENAGARRSRICDSIPLLAVSHEMTWRHLIVDPISSPVRMFENAKLEFCQRLPHANHLPLPLPAPQHPLSMMLSQNLIFVIVFTVHFHGTTWVQQGETGRGRGGCAWKPPKPFGRLAFSYWSLFKHPLPSSAETFAVQPIQEPKYFPPNCRCYRCRAHEGVHACARHVPMKRQNLSKTLKVAKKSISSHKLFIIIVTSTIHYATENNCKEISQDRNLVRMHMHRLSGRLPKQTICQIVFFSFCKLKWDPPCRFLVFQVEPKIYYFTDPDTMT